MIRAWLVQYRRAGASRRLLLGPANVLSAEVARAAAKKALAKVALGEDPQEDKAERRTKDRLTRFADVVAEYLAWKRGKVRASTFREIERYLTGSTSHHSTRCRSIPSAARILLPVSSSSGVRAATSPPHARTPISAFFTWAMQMGLVEQNPVIGVIKQKSAEREHTCSPIPNSPPYGGPAGMTTLAAS